MSSSSQSGMFKKKEVFTVITPIPAFIPRQLAIDILHSHSEVISLNPLVLGHKPIKAPRDAKEDEYFSTWYEIEQRIQYVPGLGKLGSGKISFNGCFHNMSWGLQTHIYAPANVDLKNKYIIAGNQSGVEPPEQLEIGLRALGAPADGLYLREEIEIKANIVVVGFVKAELQRAGGEMVKRIIKKAELLDAGVLQAMMEDGKLKTINPADRSNTFKAPLQSPTSLRYSSSISVPGSPPPQSPAIPYKTLRPQSYQPSHRPGTASSQAPGPYNGHSSQSSTPAPTGYLQGPHFGAAELPSVVPTPYLNSVPVEMPGDFYHSQSSPNLHPPQAQHSPGLPSNRNSATSGASNGSRFSPDPSQSEQWSNMESRPNSTTSAITGPSNGYPSPGLDKGFASELPTHTEDPLEHRNEALNKLDPRIPQPSHYQTYNPQDYANIAKQNRRMQAGYNQQGPRYG